MAFRDFAFPQVQHQLGLRIEDEDLFLSTAPFHIHEEIASFVLFGAKLALANSTEKAKSEFIIAPILVELRRSLGMKFVLFSCVEWDVDTEHGLNGYCDFILGRGPSQHILQAPFLAIVEAKNDLIRTGLGPCIAAMYAARISNERAGIRSSVIHGVVTTGAAWKFLQMKEEKVIVDTSEYFIDNLPKIMGILKYVIETNFSIPSAK